MKKGERLLTFELNTTMTMIGDWVCIDYVNFVLYYGQSRRLNVGGLISSSDLLYTVHGAVDGSVRCSCGSLATAVGIGKARSPTQKQPIPNTSNQSESTIMTNPDGQSAIAESP